MSCMGRPALRPVVPLAAAAVLVLSGCGGTDRAIAPAATPAGPTQAATSPVPTRASEPAAPPTPATTPPTAKRSRPPPRSPGGPTPSPTTAPAAVFASTISAITPAIRARMPYSWRAGCPAGLEDLRYLTVSFHGFDGAVHRGELVVSAGQADAVVRVMGSLFAAGYPIRQMRLVDVYRADDDASVAADNTSAFNCREVAGRPGVWSQHAYGVAIDVNPLENPYVHTDGSVDIPASRPYVDRSLRATGLIHASDATVDAFTAVGWRWGGYWSGAKDYQHFSSTGR